MDIWRNLIPQIKQQITKQEEKIISISSFIQTFLYLTIYLVMVAHVLRKIRPMNLQKQDKITVGTFIFCQTLNLIVQCAYMVLELKENFMDSQEMIDDLLKVGQTITSNLNYFVLFFYTYQLRVVHIKLTAQTPADFNQELKKTNIIWLILFVEQIFSFTLKLIKIYSQHERVLKAILVAFGILTEGYIIYLQVFYIGFILSKKTEVKKAQGKRWSCRSKTLIAWIYIVLAINAINYVVFNIMNIVLLSMNDNDYYNFLTTYTQPFAMFWFDTLNLTNGICFLKLFESMAKSQLKQRKKLVVMKQRSDTTVSGQTKRLLQDDAPDPKSGKLTSMGTNSVLDLLNQKSNHNSINEDLHDSDQEIRDEDQNQDQFPGTNTQQMKNKLSTSDDTSEDQSQSEHHLRFQKEQSSLYNLDRQLNARLRSEYKPKGQFNNKMQKDVLLLSEEEGEGVQRRNKFTQEQLENKSSDSSFKTIEQRSFNQLRNQMKSSFMYNQMFQDYLMHDLDQQNKFWHKKLLSSRNSESATASMISKRDSLASQMKPTQNARDTGNFNAIAYQYPSEQYEKQSSI